MPKAESSGHDMDGNLLAEADASKTITKYYIHGLGLAAMVVPGTVDDVYTYHFNAIGSTVAITDANQVPVNMYAYTPFGIVSEAETIPQPFKYVGQYGVMHEQNGFYYMRARYYDPNVGRFVSEDPIKFSGGTVNLYEYVGNLPVRFIDPSGLSPFNWLKPILNPYGFYMRAHALRIWGQNRWGGPDNSYIRHHNISFILTLEYGGMWTRIAGLGNEIQGFLWHDIWMLESRLNGDTQWAFSLDDFIANEDGIRDALECK